MSIRQTILLVGLSLPATLVLGCGRDWDAFDPRLGAEGPGGASISSSSTSGVGGQGTSSGVGGQGTSTSSSASGAGGAGGGGATSSSASGAGGAGGGGVPTCAAMLQNGFNDGTVDDATWEHFSSSDLAPTETNGSLVFEFPSMSAENVWGMLQSRTVYNLSGCAVVARVQEVPSDASESYTNLVLTAGDDYIELLLMYGKLHFKLVTPVKHTPYGTAVAHDPVKHAYWRIREDAGTTYWDTSADGAQWETHASTPNPLSFEGIRVSLSTGTLLPVTQTMGNARFDALSVGPP